MVSKENLLEKVDGIIGKRTLDKFLEFGEPDQFLVILYNDACDDKRKQVAATATKRIGEKGYHLIFSNCDAFCVSCWTGRYVHSDEIRFILENANHLVKLVPRRKKQSKQLVCLS